MFFLSMQRKVYSAFRRLVAKVSGYGFRRYLPGVNLIYKKLNKFLSPVSVNVQGHIMFLDDDDSLGLAVHGEYETAETKIIQEQVSLGQIVLDIGANIGYFTLNFARLVGEQGRVYAFEPDPISFEILKRNVNSNGYQNVILEPIAVSNVSARAFLQRDKYNNLDHQLVRESKSSKDMAVRTIRLDDYFHSIPESVDFVKLDIQGAEGLALEGMRNLLLRSRHAKLLTEFWPVGLERFGGINSAAHYLHELERLGFDFFEIDKISNAFFQRSSEELLKKYLPSSRKYANLLCIRGIEK